MFRSLEAVGNGYLNHNLFPTILNFRRTHKTQLNLKFPTQRKKYWVGLKLNAKTLINKCVAYINEHDDSNNATFCQFKYSFFSHHFANVYWCNLHSISIASFLFSKFSERFLSRWFAALQNHFFHLFLRFLSIHFPTTFVRWLRDCCFSIQLLHSFFVFAEEQSRVCIHIHTMCNVF